MQKFRLLLTTIIYTFISLIVFNNIASAGEVLDNIRKTQKITLCAGPYAWPYTSSVDYPRGFDIDILERIAMKEELIFNIYWAEQKMRGGLGKALRHSIQKGRCDIYMGIANSDSSADEIKEKRLILTQPYLGVAYVPIANPGVKDFVNMEEIKGKSKPGVSMSTAMDGYLFYNGYDRDLFARKPTEIDAVAKQEIEMAFVMSTSLAKARRKYKDAPFRVIKSFNPPLELRWNVAATIQNDKEFLELMNKHLTEMMADGTIKELVEKYNVPYYPPFKEIASTYTTEPPEEGKGKLITYEE
ncbi:MAG: transporter substrate-binding domain-containing protein [Pelagibacterales bacterium]|jgi:ABC-type amino acid transport substrate-binding protein|nr:transporter substrate-binding domain-containing protein [Pelagibacterales bacterium]MBT7077376.1 transporter substrate-binding domain-containing protein [Pelagibacterales bacterium]